MFGILQYFLLNKTNHSFNYCMQNILRQLQQYTAYFNVCCGTLCDNTIKGFFYTWSSERNGSRGESAKFWSFNRLSLTAIRIDPRPLNVVFVPQNVALGAFFFSNSFFLVSIILSMPHKHSFICLSHSVTFAIDSVVK